MDHELLTENSLPVKNDEILNYDDGYSKNSTEFIQNKIEDSELDNQLQKFHSELCDQFRQILSERQELRRKNIFLQKKMVEFFKKRKMDHVLKEDPKGLDLESKYLKRLNELEDTKKAFVISREQIQTLFNNLKDETAETQNRVKISEKEFFDRQKKIALSLQLKSKKSISIKAISSFIAGQVGNAVEVQRQRFLEIKERRLLEEKQILSKTLDNLGKGIKRADYELLHFEFENTLRLYNEKTTHTNLFDEKIRTLAENLNKTVKVADILEKNIISKTQQCEESEQQMIEVRHRLLKLKKMSKKMRKEKEELKNRTGLLSQPHLLRDFEISLQEMNLLKKKLEQLNCSYNCSSRIDNGHNNSSDFIGQPDTDATNSDCSTEEFFTQ